MPPQRCFLLKLKTIAFKLLRPKIIIYIYDWPDYKQYPKCPYTNAHVEVGLPYIELQIKKN